MKPPLNLEEKPVETGLSCLHKCRQDAASTGDNSRSVEGEKHSIPVCSCPSGVLEDAPMTESRRMLTGQLLLNMSEAETGKGRRSS